MKFLISMILLVPTLSEARLIKKCGTYYAEGYYTEIESNLHNKKKKRVILLCSQIRTFWTSEAVAANNYCNTFFVPSGQFKTCCPCN